MRAIRAGRFDELARRWQLAPWPIGGLRGPVGQGLSGYRAASPENSETIKAYLDEFESLCRSRSGMFQYNNEDHATATGIYAARTALGHAASTRGGSH